MGGRPPQGGYYRFPLARSAAHLRLKAGHGRCRPEHRARTAWSFRLRDDAALCASGAGAQGSGGCKAGERMILDSALVFFKRVMEEMGVEPKPYVDEILAIINGETPDSPNYERLHEAFLASQKLEDGLARTWGRIYC